MPFHPLKTGARGAAFIVVVALGIAAGIALECAEAVALVAGSVVGRRRR